MSDQPDPETSTWKHTTLTTDRHPCPWQDSNPQSQQASGRRPGLRPPGHRDRLNLSHQQATDRDSRTACLTQKGLTAILQEFMSFRESACEARDEIRREKEKLINKLECKFMSCDSICIHRCVRKGVYSPCVKESKSLSRKTNVNFRDNKLQIEAVVSHSGILRSVAVVELVRNLMAHAQKPDFVFRLNGRVHLNRRWSQFSRLLAAEVCPSALVMLDTLRPEVVWEYWLPTPYANFPFTSPPVRHRVPPYSERSIPPHELLLLTADNYIWYWDCLSGITFMLSSVTTGEQVSYGGHRLSHTHTHNMGIS